MVSRPAVQVALLWGQSMGDVGLLDFLKDFLGEAVPKGVPKADWSSGGSFPRCATSLVLQLPTVYWLFNQIGSESQRHLT